MSNTLDLSLVIGQSSLVRSVNSDLYPEGFTPIVAGIHSYDKYITLTMTSNQSKLTDAFTADVGTYRTNFLQWFATNVTLEIAATDPSSPVILQFVANTSGVTPVLLLQDQALGAHPVVQDINAVASYVTTNYSKQVKFSTEWGVETQNTLLNLQIPIPFGTRPDHYGLRFASTAVTGTWITNDSLTVSLPSSSVNQFLSIPTTIAPPPAVDSNGILFYNPSGIPVTWSNSSITYNDTTITMKMTFVSSVNTFLSSASSLNALKTYIMEHIVKLRITDKLNQSEVLTLLQYVTVMNGNPTIQVETVQESSQVKQTVTIAGVPLSSTSDEVIFFTDDSAVSTHTIRSVDVSGFYNGFMTNTKYVTFTPNDTELFTANNGINYYGISITPDIQTDRNQYADVRSVFTYPQVGFPENVYQLNPSTHSPGSDTLTVNFGFNLPGIRVFQDNMQEFIQAVGEKMFIDITDRSTGTKYTSTMLNVAGASITMNWNSDMPARLYEYFVPSGQNETPKVISFQFDQPDINIPELIPISIRLPLPWDTLPFRYELGFTSNIIPNNDSNQFMNAIRIRLQDTFIDGGSIEYPMRHPSIVDQAGFVFLNSENISSTGYETGYTETTFGLQFSFPTLAFNPVTDVNTLGDRMASLIKIQTTSANGTEYAQTLSNYAYEYGYTLSYHDISANRYQIRNIPIDPTLQRFFIECGKSTTSTTLTVDDRDVSDNMFAGAFLRSIDVGVDSAALPVVSSEDGQVDFYGYEVALRQTIVNRYETFGLFMELQGEFVPVNEFVESADQDRVFKQHELRDAINLRIDFQTTGDSLYDLWNSTGRTSFESQLRASLEQIQTTTFVSMITPTTTLHIRETEPYSLYILNAVTLKDNFPNTLGSVNGFPMEITFPSANFDIKTPENEFVNGEVHRVVLDTSVISFAYQFQFLLLGGDVFNGGSFLDTPVNKTVDYFPPDDPSSSTPRENVPSNVSSIHAGDDYMTIVTNDVVNGYQAMFKKHEDASFNPMPISLGNANTIQHTLVNRAGDIIIQVNDDSCETTLQSVVEHNETLHASAPYNAASVSIDMPAASDPVYNAIQVSNKQVILGQFSDPAHPITVADSPSITIEETFMLGSLSVILYKDTSYPDNVPRYFLAHNDYQHVGTWLDIQREAGSLIHYFNNEILKKSRFTHFTVTDLYNKNDTDSLRYLNTETTGKSTTIVQKSELLRRIANPLALDLRVVHIDGERFIQIGEEMKIAADEITGDGTKKASLAVANPVEIGFNSCMYFQMSDYDLDTETNTYKYDSDLFQTYVVPDTEVDSEGNVVAGDDVYRGVLFLRFNNEQGVNDTIFEFDYQQRESMFTKPFVSTRGKYMIMLDPSSALVDSQLFIYRTIQVNANADGAVQLIREPIPSIMSYVLQHIPTAQLSDVTIRDVKLSTSPLGIFVIYNDMRDGVAFTKQATFTSIDPLSYVPILEKYVRFSDRNVNDVYVGNKVIALRDDQQRLLYYRFKVENDGTIAWIPATNHLTLPTDDNLVNIVLSRDTTYIHYKDFTGSSNVHRVEILEGYEASI